MALKIRAVFFNPDHTNKVRELKKKDMEGNGKQFKDEGGIYFINDKHFQITFKRLWWTLWIIKVYYTTYYYKRGASNPIAVPDFADIVRSGIEPDELAAIFDPWFLRTISNPAKDLMDQLGFYISVGTFLGVCFIIWQMLSGQADGSEAEAVAP